VFALIVIVFAELLKSAYAKSGFFGEQLIFNLVSVFCLYAGLKWVWSYASYSAGAGFWRVAQPESGSIWSFVFLHG
jgi:hypothetical protein